MPGLPSELSLPAPLRAYQWKGVSFLAHGESALLCDEMGLGKTVQAAVALRIALRHDGAGRALIVCPASLVLTWTAELEKWAPELVTRQVGGSARNRAATYALPVQVLIASYEQVRIDGLTNASNVPFDLVVLDEAQRIKNANSTTALACRLLQRRRAWALTGTPVENTPADLVGIFKFVRPGLLSHALGRRAIHERIAPYFLRRRKQEVLGELPPIITQDVPLELSDEQRASYNEIWYAREATLERLGGPTTTNLLTVITRLKQACNYDPGTGESIKLDYLSDVLENVAATDEKVIVFSQYVETLRWLSDRIEIDHRLYTGELSKETRNEFVSWFEKGPGPRLLLISLRAGGVGINLKTADHVVLFDRWWNPALESQAIQRAHRFGREKPLHVHRLRVLDSIEDRIAQILEHKERIFDEYVNEAPSANIEATKHELLHILSLTGPTVGITRRKNES